MFAIKALYSRAYSSLISARHQLFSMKSQPPPIIQPSQSKKSEEGLSDSAQKAIMASKIINLILQEKMPQSFQDQSLSQQIVSLGPKIGKYQITPQIRQQFNEMFTSGINLNDNIYKQHRIWDAMQNKQKTAKQNKTDKLTQLGQYGGGNNFIFFPTRLTTGQIFQILAVNYKPVIYKQRNFFVTGGFGIGKTVSIILYNQLSKYIHEYHLKFIDAKKAAANKKVTDQSKKIFQEYNRLIAQKLLFIVPKCLYWTINKNIDQKHQLNIEEVIFQQIGELSEGKRKQLRDCIQMGSLKLFSDKLKSLYQAVHIKGVVDQLNILVEILREYNKHQAQRRSGTLRDRIVIENGVSKVQTVDEQEMLQTQRNERMEILMKSLSNYRKCGHNTIFFSSVNIERELLQASTAQRKSIQIYGKNWHQIPFERTIQFQNLLRQNPGANIIFWQFFYFQMKRRLLQRKVQSEKLAKIKKTFFDKCQQSKAQVSSYFRIVYIRIFFEQRSKILSNILQITEQKQLSEQLGNLITKFRIHCIENTRNKFNIFLNKNNDKSEKSQKITFLLRLYQNALNCYNQKDENQNQKKEDSQTLEANQQKEDSQNLEDNQQKEDSQFLEANQKKYVTIEPNLFDKFLKKYIKQYKSSDTVEYQMDREFFAFQEVSSTKLRLLLGPKQVVEILYDVLFPRIAELIPFGRYYKEYVKKYKAPRGLLMENTFLECLIYGVKVMYDVQQPFSKNPDTKKSQRKQFNICEKMAFTSLRRLGTNKKQQIKSLKKINSVGKCFEKLLETAKLKPGQHFVGIPYKNSQEGYVFDDVSPTIDFVIGFYDKEQNIFNLSTFDLTIGKKFEDKQQKAINLLQNLLMEEQRVNITHTILCPKSVIPKTLRSIISNQNLTIQYADIYNVSFYYDSLEAGEKVHFYKQLIRLFENFQQQEQSRKKKKNDH